MTPKIVAAMLTFTLLSMVLLGQSADTIQKELNLHAERLSPWTSDPWAYRARSG
jgi:hypothetical protein